MLTRRQIPVFWRNILFPSSGLKMEIVCFSEMLVSTYKFTWHYNPENQHPLYFFPTFPPRTKPIRIIPKFYSHTIVSKNLLCTHQPSFNPFVLSQQRLFLKVTYSESDTVLQTKRKILKYIENKINSLNKSEVN
jgi:hypothetical protein